MNRILFEELRESYTLPVRDPRFEHVRGVLRMQVGDRFDIGVLNGPAGKATVQRLDKESLTVSADWGERPPLPPDLHLLVGLCRPATVRKILSTAPTLGVRSVTFAGTGRSDPDYACSRIWRDGTWRRYLIEGVEQAFDTYRPAVRVHDSLEAALATAPERSERLALDVYESTESLGRHGIDAGRPVLLAIGPERGWNAADRKILLASGCRLCSAGTRVLRVETAVTVGLTLILRAMGAL